MRRGMFSNMYMTRYSVKVKLDMFTNIFESTEILKFYSLVLSIIWFQNIKDFFMLFICWLIKKKLLFQEIKKKLVDCCLFIILEFLDFYLRTLKWTLSFENIKEIIIVIVIFEALEVLKISNLFYWTLLFQRIK